MAVIEGEVVRVPTRAELQFEGWYVPGDFVSDGCTWLRDRLFGLRITAACRLHDFQRRYAIVGARDADAIMRRYWLELGVHPVIAWPLWALARIGSLVFRRTWPLPPRWRLYAKPAPALEVS